LGKTVNEVLTITFWIIAEAIKLTYKLFVWFLKLIVLGIFAFVVGLFLGGFFSD